MPRVTFIFVLMYPIGVLASLHQSAAIDKRPGVCGAAEDAARKDPPVVYGKPHVVPNFRLRIVDSRSAINGREVIAGELVSQGLGRCAPEGSRHRSVGTRV